MIIVRLLGGLGNQMFQYACGKALATKLNVPLYLDSTFLKLRQENVTFRNYELGIFNLGVEFISEIELKKRGLLFNGNRIKKIFNYTLAYLLNYRIYRESELGVYSSSFDRIAGKTYLVGYFQSEKYFRSIENIIRKEFSFNISMSSLNKKYAESILSTNSVSIHIRRGDYITNEVAKQFHGSCSLDYYRNALNYIENHIKAPHFFIFSDDLNWAKENLSINHDFTLVEGNHGKSSYEDMRLMSLCKHNIIANSSFSWWGAWLNINPDKIVVAPDKWFAVDHFVPKDLIPECWKVLN